MKTLKKGLKKGDRFMDGKRCFVIYEVLEPGRYLSHEVSEEEAEDEVSEEEDEDAEGSCLNCSTVEELRQMAREMNLPATGRKAELIERIEGMKATACTDHDKKKGAPADVDQDGDE